jgi:hypothetical protein
VSRKVLGATLLQIEKEYLRTELDKILKANKGLA